MFTSCIYKYYMCISAMTGKKETLLLSTTQMDLENIVLSEVSRTEKDKHGTISLTCKI